MAVGPGYQTGFASAVLQSTGQWEGAVFQQQWAAAFEVRAGCPRALPLLPLVQLCSGMKSIALKLFTAAPCDYMVKRR